MPKHIVHDVIPPEKKSIRNIPIPERRAGMRPRRPVEERPVEIEVEKPKRRPEPSEGDYRDTRVRPNRVAYDESDAAWQKRISGGGRKGGKRGVWVAVFLAIFALAFAVSSLFSGATARVTPRQALAEVSGTFPASSIGDETAVPFEIVKVTREDGREVAASKEQYVERKASGTIVIYNNNSSSPQRLVKNTRFETDGGLIYRITDSVEVPGAKIEGGEMIPGSIEAVVTADQAGDKFNIGPADFKIPGFKGDPKYETFYARSKTEMTGGFAGNTKVIADDVLAQAKDEMQFALREQLAKDLEAQIPHNFTSFDEGLVYSFSDLPQTAGDGDSARVNVRGELYAVIFDKSVLGGIMAERFLPEYNGGQVEISNLDELTFAIENAAEFDPKSDTSFDFTLNGNANLLWQYDEAALKQDLAGSSKRDVNRILAKYPAIETAEVTVRPFWSRSLPKDVKKIKISNVIGNAGPGGN